MNEVWVLVRAEREALVDDLSTLEPARWDTPSLCPGWSVHDVAAHLVDNAKATPVGLVVAMARARFDFDRQNDQGMRRERGATPAETLSRLRAVVGRTTGPPVSLDSRLVEEVVHGEDIRVPLGLTHVYAPEAVERALRYQARTATGMGGGRERVAGVRMRATDSDLTLGEGPEVHGTALALLMATSGRPVSGLEGPGVGLLG